MLGIMMNPLAISESTSSSTLVGDVKDHNRPVSDLRIDPHRRASSAIVRIMIDPSATLELTSSSTLIGDVEDHDELINDLSINIGDLRIDLIVDLLLACRSACYLAN